MLAITEFDCRVLCCLAPVYLHRGETLPFYPDLSLPKSLECTIATILNISCTIMFWGSSLPQPNKLNSSETMHINYLNLPSNSNQISIGSIPMHQSDNIIRRYQTEAQTLGSSEVAKTTKWHRLDTVLSSGIAFVLLYYIYAVLPSLCLVSLAT